MNIIKLIISVLICQGAGFIGSLFTAPSISVWYATLNKPFFSPPNFVFAPVWIALFFLMGISLYIIWDRGLNRPEARIAVFTFGFQLVLNILWSVLFFGLKSPYLAFVEIVVLWLLILITGLKFYDISKAAGLLFLPYILWVSFALILNYSIWQLNL